MGVFPGFPSTARPDAFNGVWQYHPQGIGNDGVVGATLTRWNPQTQQRSGAIRTGACLGSDQGLVSLLRAFPVLKRHGPGYRHRDDPRLPRHL